jgi:nitrite reductase/ring-hydroxylating ferredoxin subunit/uncharacterized membrane protein
MEFSGAAARGSFEPLTQLTERIESEPSLDDAAKTIAAKIRGAIPQGPFKDAISGTWLGHALHPLLTDVVIGSFTSATLLDLLGGDADGKASERLIAIGIAAYGPTALAGANDWADGEPASDAVRRMGIVHAATNSVALSLYTASLLARRRGNRTRGKALATAGALVLGTGGYLGGHLTFSQGQGVDQSVFDPGPDDWTAAAKTSELTENEPTRAVAADTPVLLLRRGERIFAIHDRCSHRGCSLSDGELDGDEIVCACHGSRFDLGDGSLRAGPASAPQPAFETRERDGSVEVRRRVG